MKSHDNICKMDGILFIVYSVFLLAEGIWLRFGGGFVGVLAVLLVPEKWKKQQTLK